uniref:RNase III domain-containing protein n=1 Tax=Globisporangium ultimum (strain ATCC 200006 / CBS 805.95 / DAOM BR144) TaxID=431595 RepID=K3X5W5_GLOUD
MGGGRASTVDTRSKWSRRVRSKQLKYAKAPASTTHFPKVRPQRSAAHEATISAQKAAASRAKKRRQANGDDDEFDDEESGVSRRKRRRAYSESSDPFNGASFLDVIDDFHAILASTGASPTAMHGSSSHAAFAEVYEWIGDAVLGELVGRCLLSQFHHAPLSARVFRNLRLAVVTNRNLAQVYEKMGYERRHPRRGVCGVFATQTQQQSHAAASRDPRKKLKEKADVVEAVVGELMVRLDRQSNDTRVCTQYRNHLDALLATMLHVHFGDRTRARQVGGTAGPLSVSFNPFSCLPEEQLDEETGELVVHEGSFEDEFEAAVHDPSREQELQEKSFVDLIEECKESAKDGLGGSHHAFVDVASLVENGGNDDSSELASTLLRDTHRAMQQLGEHHVLRLSKEIFEVFKIYGMTVLAERVSLALAQPHLDRASSLQRSKLETTPALLTRQRQRVLSVINLAQCGILLGVASEPIFFDTTGGLGSERDETAQRVAEERLRANTLRAFVGFHSALATTSAAVKSRSSALVNKICLFLQAKALGSDQVKDEPLEKKAANPFIPGALLVTRRECSIPEREPLVSLMRSVGEAKVFMNSATCAALHLRGERPVMPNGNSNPSFLLRQCDSEEVEDLFETLAKDQEREKRMAQDKEREEKHNKKKKNQKSKATNESSGPALATNLSRFLHRRFLFCLEEIVILFAQRQTEACRASITKFQGDLEPCSGEFFRKWEVSTSTLTLAMRDSFYRLLLHDICQFHAVVSSSKNTRDGTRVTQLRLPMHYSWAKNVARRITTEEAATG